MTEDDPPVVTLRRSTAIRIGIGALVVVALVVGIGIGVLVASSHGDKKHVAAPTSASVRPNDISTTATTTTTASSTTTTAPLPTITLGGPWTGIRPTFIAFSADGGNVVDNITWASWDGTGAIGHGTGTHQSCVPDCLHGPSSQYPVTLTLDVPIDGQFTRLTEQSAYDNGGSTALPVGPGDRPAGGVQ